MAFGFVMEAWRRNEGSEPLGGGGARVDFNVWGSECRHNASSEYTSIDWTTDITNFGTLVEKVILTFQLSVIVFRTIMELWLTQLIKTTGIWCKVLHTFSKISSQCFECIQYYQLSNQNHNICKCGLKCYNKQLVKLLFPMPCWKSMLRVSAQVSVE